MHTKAPACRPVCKDQTLQVMDELVDCLARLRFKGLRETEALTLVSDPATLVRIFPAGSLGTYPTVATALIESGCAECAVNKAYSA